MSHMYPQVEAVEKYAFYDLIECKWPFSKIVDVTVENCPILIGMCQHFSKLSGLPVEKVTTAFDATFNHPFKTQNILMLYTYKGSDNVFYELINQKADTYRRLAG